jgi:hypothetical protein
MPKLPNNRIPADSAEYLSGPMPRYPNGIWTINGKTIDVNKLTNKFDPEAAAAQVIPDAQRHLKKIFGLGTDVNDLLPPK